jgi:hypothetical protein
MIKEHSANAAHTLFFASASGTGIVWLAELDTVISIIAGVVAITAGCVSIYMHITRRKNRKDESQ